MNFPRLIEMIATGDLLVDDEVSVMGAGFRKIGDIEALARHLLPSTSATTGRLFEPGAPDYQVDLRDTPMLEVLARLRQKAETGALFVERRDQTRRRSARKSTSAGGRLLHVASSDRAELLGEYLVRRGALERADLERALGMLERYGGRLGDTLVGLGHRRRRRRVSRDPRSGPRPRRRALRLAARARGLLPRDRAGPRRVSARSRSREPDDGGSDHQVARRSAHTAARGRYDASAPAPGSTPWSIVTNAVPRRCRSSWSPRLCEEGVDVAGAIARMTSQSASGQSRPIGEKEACAALVTAKHLGWILL